MICVYCRERPATTEDHIRPRAWGGTDDPANLTDACVPCNSQKNTLPAELVGASSRTIARWLRARGWRLIGRQEGPRSSWLAPGDEATLYTRASAIRHAAWGGG